jgi:HK97 family phage prohead protease
MWDMFGPYTEQVSPGAFGKTLATRTSTCRWCCSTTRCAGIARTTNGTLTLEEDDHGLRRRAAARPADADVAYIAPKLRSGLIDEMSFRFRITAGQWSPDWMEYHIDEVDITAATSRSSATAPTRTPPAPGRSPA